MSPRPKRTKKDLNHAEIVNQCRDLGMIVWDTASLGGEILDIIIFWKGIATPVEIKSPGGTLTKDEKTSLEKLAKAGIKAIIAYTIEDILEVYDRN